MFESATLKFINEATLLVEYGDTLDDAIYEQVLSLDHALNSSKYAAYLETLPSFRSLMIQFDALSLSHQALLDILSELNAQAPTLPTVFTTTHWRVPICFDPDGVEDLQEVADLLKISAQQVISLLLANPLKLYMYGFAPGFAYLGGLHASLNIPRRATPRAPMPTNALMIAGGLASLTSVSLPTGWYVLGQTPLTLFSADRQPMVPFSVGDSVHLYEVSLAEFNALAERGDSLDIVEAIKSST